MKTVLLTVVILASASAAYADDYCKYSRDIEQKIDLQSVDKVEVKAGAGDLSITGSNRDDVLVKARLCANDKDMLDDMSVLTDMIAGAIRVEAEFPYKDRGWFGGANKKMLIDMDVELPSSVALDVVDSSGSAIVKNVANLVIKDSSGELEIFDIAGDLSLTDSSGGLTIENVGGNIIATDSSGDIDIANVGGNLTIDADSSGGIDIENVRQNILIKRDSSGSISVTNVGGDFTVGSDGSGGIHYERVSGRVSLPNK